MRADPASSPLPSQAEARTPSSAGDACCLCCMTDSHLGGTEKGGWEQWGWGCEGEGVYSRYSLGKKMFEVCVKLAGGRPPVILCLLLPSLKISDVVYDDLRQPSSFL